MNDEIVGTLKARVSVIAYTDRGEECYESIIPDEVFEQVKQEQADQYNIPKEAVGMSFDVLAYPMIDGEIEIEIEDYVKGSMAEAEEAIEEAIENKFYLMTVDKIDVHTMEFKPHPESS